MYKFIICDDCQSRKSLLEAVENASGTTAIVGENSALWDFDIGIDLYTLPFIFLHCASEFTKDPVVNTQTRATFNVMINKKMDHRYLTLRLIEYFDLKDFVYTYSGSAKSIDDTNIFKDLDLCDPKRQMFPPDIMMQILGDVTIPPVFFGKTNFLELAKQQGVVPDCGYHDAWQAGLDQIFSSTLVSLITESDNGDYDKVTVFTEKTVYAILGLTIPIWPGGYKHADRFEIMGFDVFSDIIDHSYQFEDTMFMRCWRAFRDNFELLNDLAKAKKLREVLMPRLIFNRQHLFSNELVDWYHHNMKTWPIEIKNTIHKKWKCIDPRQNID
jgi:hypothetical protein